MDLPPYTGTEPCAQVGVDWFFTDEVTGRKVNAAEMRQVCDGCDLLVECREYALHNSVSGFWGGTTERERRRIRVREGIIPVPLYLGA